MSTVIDVLKAVLPANIVHSDPNVLELYSQDVFGDGLTVAAVVRPATEQDIIALVQFSRDKGIPLITRGGGMSYTSGYLATKTDSILIDTVDLNQILEINEQDAYVTVQVGVTWQKLHETLAPFGLTTPFWGTLSGRYATVGGGLSQNGIFWGSGYHGTAGDNVLSLRVVTGTGDVIETGAASQKVSSPFCSYFGPNLTSTFVGDCGAFGIKLTATLPLIPAAKHKGFTSFAFENSTDMTLAMAEISRNRLASECFGFDPYLQRQRMKRASLAADVQQFAGVIKAESGIFNKVANSAKLAFSGRRFMDDVAWSFSTLSEGRTQAEADFQVSEIRKICSKHGGQELPDSIPRLISANPFGPVNNMVGAEGERWLPIHALVPHSRAQDGIACIEGVFAKNRDTMQQYGVETGYLIATVSQQVTVLEPVLFWPDALNALHKHSLEKDHLARLNQFDAVPGAWDAVNAIKKELVQALSDFGAVHFQLGKAYKYQEGLKPESAAVVSVLKQTYDPQGIMNPGVLGFN
jgi:FAD/FMN-containing dehydrogenase